MNPTLIKCAENNPFRVSKFESLKWQNDNGSIDQIFETWQNYNFRGQIIGNHGAGKSTASKKLQKKAEQNGFECIYLFANEESRKSDFKLWENTIKESNKDSLVILDGFGHASLLKRRKLLKLHSHLLIIAHNKINKLPLISHLAPNHLLLKKLVNDLAGEEGKVALEKSGGSEFLLEKHNANLRDCFFELYKTWQKL